MVRIGDGLIVEQRRRIKVEPQHNQHGRQATPFRTGLGQS